MTKKLFVRYSRPEDEGAIFDFYASNPHHFVAGRDPAVWKERIASGAVTIIEDEAGAIVASSISYPLTKKNDKGEDIHAWTEIGSTRVALDGLGLVKILVSAQVLRAYLLEPPEDRFAIEVVKGNEHSKHVFLKMGSTLFDIPPELREKVSATMTPGQNLNVEWFQLGAEAMPQFAQNILDLLKNPAIKQGFEIDFSRCVVVKTFLGEIKKLAASDCGDVKNPDINRGLKKPPNNKFAP